MIKKLINKFNYIQREKSIEKAHIQHRKLHSSEYDGIEKIVASFRDTGGLKHDFQFYKLWSLQNLLEQYQPKSILEFGSGSSTLLFAEYTRSHGGSLLSIDEDEKWASNTSKLLNITSDDNIEVIHRKKVFLSDRKPTEMKYDIEIEKKYDLVFIDGPSFRLNGIKQKNTINSNVLELQHLPKIIIIDGRYDTALYLAEKLSDNYDVSMSDLVTQSKVNENYNYFSYFIHK
jgi:16S rRNA G966 N2-methylase RsmD